MLPSTSHFKTIGELETSLSPETDWNALRLALEERLQHGPASEVLTHPENRLLVGLRLRERFLQIPWYAEKEKLGPQWWMGLNASAGAVLVK
jgi:hypothetical protein